MAADGLSPFKISNRLSKENILTPRAYTASQYDKYKNGSHIKHPTDWNNTTIATILKNREYLGHLVCNKSTTKSFKNRKIVQNPRDNWIEIPNTHEAIVDEHLFETAQKVASVKKRENTSETVNIFVGLLKCSDCGSSLGFVKGKNEGHESAYNCNLYRKKSSQYCTAHYITHKALYQIVLDDIKRHLKNAKLYKDELLDFAISFTETRIKEDLTRQYKGLEKSQQRYCDLNNIIKKVFEQNAFGHISDERFVSLLACYESEQKELSIKIDKLKEEISQQEKSGITAEEINDIIEKLVNADELTFAILNELIHKIVISNSEIADGEKTQKIDIHYNFTF